MIRPRGTGALFFSESKGLWVYRIELPPKNGKRRTYETTAKTQKRLLEKIRDPLKRFAAVGDLPTSSMRLEDYLKYWFDTHVVTSCRPNTAAGYRSVLWTHVIPEIGTIRLDKLTAGHLRKVYTRITSTPRSASRPDGPYLTSTYALNAHRVLSKALTDAEREGLISRNPAALMDAPKKTIQPLAALSVDEAKEVLARAVAEFQKEGKYTQDLARWATYLLTGARRGEILGLEVERVTNVVELSWQLTRLTSTETLPADFEYRHIVHGMFWTRPKTIAGWRVIPLVYPLDVILGNHLALIDRNPYNLVFTTTEGLPIDPDTETKRWAKWLAASGITDKKVRLHDLRHTTIDLLYESGASEDLIMEIIGHSTRTVTRGYKSPANIRRLTETMKQLSSFLGFNENGA